MKAFLAAVCIIACLSATVVAQLNPVLEGNYQGDGISFRYPQDWVSIQANNHTAFYPTGSRYPTAKGDFYSHGFFFGMTRVNAATLEASAELMFAQLVAKSPTMTPGDRRSEVLNGFNFSWIRFRSNEGSSPIGPERGVFVVAGSPSKIYYWIMFAPEGEIESYWPIFNGILASVRMARMNPPVNEVDGAVMDLVARITERLKANKFKLPPFRIEVQNVNVINASANLNMNVVVIPTGIVKFFRNNEGELAFIVAHELGHLLDKECAALAVQQRITREGQSRLCEERADNLGMQYQMGAGYDPYDAAGAFGRIMMLQGDSTLLNVLLGRILSDHPVNMDRIEKLRKIRLNICQRYPDICRN